jgi:hypothetical protein
MHTRRTAAGIGTAALLFLVATAAGAMAADQPDDDSGRPGRERQRPGLEVGTAAPDFELPLLKQTVNEQGEKVDQVTDEKVRLSSFRGKRVVCLFMSSYT